MGNRSIVLAGGMESMSKIPHYTYLRKPTGYGHANLIDAIQFDGLTDVYNNSAYSQDYQEIDHSQNKSKNQGPRRAKPGNKKEMSFSKFAENQVNASSLLSSKVISPLYLPASPRESSEC